MSLEQDGFAFQCQFLPIKSGTSLPIAILALRALLKMSLEQDGFAFHCQFLPLRSGTSSLSSSVFLPLIFGAAFAAFGWYIFRSRLRILMLILTPQVWRRIAIYFLSSTLALFSANFCPSRLTHQVFTSQFLRGITRFVWLILFSGKTSCQDSHENVV